jgi:multisubunit Na+/H+ antiporter MnhB subunit
MSGVTLVAALDVLLAASLLAVAAATIAADDAFAAAVGFVAFGLLLALVWVRIAAPDVALTEAAIGSGLTGGLLVAAGRRLGAGAPSAQRCEAPGASLRFAAGAACALVTAGLAVTVLSLSEPAPTLAPSAAAHLARTGLGNPVTAVLMAYRAIDTLLEVVVLVLAVIGIWSLAPDRFWRGRPGLLQREDPHGVLVFFARLLPPLGLLVAIHLFWIGSDAPGGEFQSATVLGAMWILAMMAGLVDAPPTDRRRLRLLLVGGPAVFLAVGFAGSAMAGSFLAYPPEHAKLLIVAIEVPVTLSVAAALVLLVAGPPARAPDRPPSR